MFIDGQQISGKYDLLVAEPNGQRLVDIKSTSAWSWIFGSRDEDHRLQMSILRYILQKGGGIDVCPVAHIIYIFTDWKRSDAKRNQDYPPQRILVKQLELLTIEQTEDWIRDRIRKINIYRELPEDQLPECTDEELWRKEDKYAVKKEGRQKAVRVFDTTEEADKYIKSNGLISGHYIEHRKGNAQRCGYCFARKFCAQFERLLANNDVDI